MSEVVLQPCRRPAQCFDAEPKDCTLCNPLVAHMRHAARVEERAKIARRVGERTILRLEAGRDPVVQANEILQDLAHDIATDWDGYEDDEP